MALTSISFLIFAVVTIVLFYLVPRKIQWLVLLISSLFLLFYNALNWANVISVLIIFLTSYFTALLITKYENKKRSKVFLIIGISIILGELFLLKYSNLFLTTINHFNNLFNINKQFNLVEFNAPLGLSYYSLMMISYLLDVYWHTHKAQKNIFKYALFMSYFPLLNSGPIVRYENMADKLYQKHSFKFTNLRRGLMRIFWGLFKILVISSRLGIFVNTVYSNYQVYNGFYILLATIFFTLQLYTNFSGSIDIIMGVSKILDIDLPENFNMPFASKTITEFWRRWHITLGAWLRDYLFYPLMKCSLNQKLGVKLKKIFGKKISKKVTLYLPMFIMWILIGIWHGGAYKFILATGVCQFIFIFLEDLLTPLANKINTKLGINPHTFGYHLYQIIRTFLLFSLTMIFFRAQSLSEGWLILKNLFVWNPWILFDHSSLYTLGLDIWEFHVLFIALIVLFGVEIINQKEDILDKLFSQNIVFRWTLIYILLFAIIIFGYYGPGYDATVFIYRQF